MAHSYYPTSAIADPNTEYKFNDKSTPWIALSVYTRQGSQISDWFLKIYDPFPGAQCSSWGYKRDLSPCYLWHLNSPVCKFHTFSTNMVLAWVLVLLWDTLRDKCSNASLFLYYFNIVRIMSHSVIKHICNFAATWNGAEWKSRTKF